jgi:hypothetical protein
MYEVKDGSKRLLQFEGSHLAFASSYRPGRSRWVEFTLYRTDGGQYVLSRVGMTKIFHLTDCSIATKNNTPVVPAIALPQDAVGCPDCRPVRELAHLIEDEGDVCMETPRYWAQVSETPEAVVDAVYKYNDAGARYLTEVAQRLLDDASEVDEAVKRVYLTETVF